MAGPYLVKKYANRKLYDTVTRRYVTLRAVAELVRSGIAIRIVDQASGDDITTATLGTIPSMSTPSKARSGRRTSPPSRPANTPSTVKGLPSAFRGLLSASLTVPATLAGTRAIDVRDAVPALIAGTRRSINRMAELNAEVTELRTRVEMLDLQVDELRSDLARLRQSTRGTAR